MLEKKAGEPVTLIWCQIPNMEGSGCIELDGLVLLSLCCIVLYVLVELSLCCIVLYVLVVLSCSTVWMRVVWRMKGMV